MGLSIRQQEGLYSTNFLIIQTLPVSSVDHVRDEHPETIMYLNLSSLDALSTGTQTRPFLRTIVVKFENFCFIIQYGLEACRCQLSTHKQSARPVALLPPDHFGLILSPLLYQPLSLLKLVG